jgi:putative transposase
MMSTYTQILYQIVFTTENREHILIKFNIEELYNYNWGVLYIFIFDCEGNQL